MSLRQRLERSTLLAGLLARLVWLYLGLCHRTIRWQVDGRSSLAADLARGPVLLVCWHGRSLMAPLHWPVAAGPLSSLHDASPIGRVSGALQRLCGLQPMEMAQGTSNRAASRMILRRVREGVSIGLTGDGPLGPAGRMKDAPLEWARVTGMPVWGYAFGCARHRRLSTWDRMLFPRPFGQGRVVFARWDNTLSRQATPDEIEAARQSLAAFLDDLGNEADKALQPRTTGRPPASGRLR